MSVPTAPGSWTAPDAPDDAVSARSVGTPAHIADMLIACSNIGLIQGPRFVAFFACMDYAMRPSEVTAFTEEGYLHGTGSGRLTFADANPAGRAFTDDGAMHEHRGLKGRNKGRPALPHACATFSDSQPSPCTNLGRWLGS